MGPSNSAPLYQFLHLFSKMHLASHQKMCQKKIFAVYPMKWNENKTPIYILHEGLETAAIIKKNIDIISKY